MTIVASYDWESDTFTHHAEHASRAAWREAVAEIAEKAKVTLPDCAGRVDRAVAIVLNHDVELLEDGKAKVASQSNGTVVYHIVDGECSCKDYAKAPSNWCKHRIAAGLYKRATALIQRKRNGASNDISNAQAVPDPAPAQDATPAQPMAQEPALTHSDALTAPLPEAPVSITLKATLHGHEVMVTLRGVDFASVKAQVEQASEWLKVQVPTQLPTQSTDQPLGWCAKHGVPMKLNHKDGRSWWSHKTAEGWCKGK